MDALKMTETTSKNHQLNSLFNYGVWICCFFATCFAFFNCCVLSSVCARCDAVRHFVYVMISVCRIAGDLIRRTAQRQQMKRTFKHSIWYFCLDVVRHITDDNYRNDSLGWLSSWNFSTIFTLIQCFNRRDTRNLSDNPISTTPFNHFSLVSNRSLSLTPYVFSLLVVSLLRSVFLSQVRSLSASFNFHHCRWSASPKRINVRSANLSFNGWLWKLAKLQIK